MIIREATVADAVSVAPRLRTEDRMECEAALGFSPEVALPFGVTAGENWVFEIDGTVEAILGVSPVGGNPYFGMVWMMTTEAIFDHRKELLRATPRVLEMLHDRFPLIGNHVDVRNTKHIDWLKKVGFSMLRVIPEFGVERRPFIEFAKLRAEPCAQ